MDQVSDSGIMGSDTIVAFKGPLKQECITEQPYETVRLVGVAYLLPRDLQVELDSPQVVDVHSHHLRHRREQVLGLADHAAHQHVSGQALQLGHLTAQTK